MQELDPDYLTKDEKIYKVTLRQFSILMMNILIANMTEEVGWQHARETFDSFCRRLKKYVLINQSDLENAFYACNMLNERGKFIHPDGIKLETFVRSMIDRNQRYNYYYNWIQDDIGERKLRNGQEKGIKK